jgi:hypothetical protein
MPMRLSVGSPLTRNAEPGGRLRHGRAVAAALLADHEQQADARSPAHAAFAAATCAARMPLASHAPRPKSAVAHATRKNGGTQSNAWTARLGSSSCA